MVDHFEDSFGGNRLGNRLGVDCAKDGDNQE
jgi:hypothetical protein